MCRRCFCHRNKHQSVITHPKLSPLTHTEMCVIDRQSGLNHRALISSNHYIAHTCHAGLHACKLGQHCVAYAAQNFRGRLAQSTASSTHSADRFPFHVIVILSAFVCAPHVRSRATLEHRLRQRPLQSTKVQRSPPFGGKSYVTWWPVTTISRAVGNSFVAVTSMREFRESILRWERARKCTGMCYSLNVYITRMQ